MAILSLMARLGSSDPVRLCASHEEMIEGFDIARFGAAPTKFDPEDLEPLTTRVVHGLAVEEVAEHLSAVPGELRAQYWHAVRANVSRRSEAGSWWQSLADSDPKDVAEEDREFVSEALDMLPAPPYDAETWSTWTSAVGNRTGRKGRSLFMPLRLAVTGQSRGPEMADVMPLLQKKPGL